MAPRANPDASKEELAREILVDENLQVNLRKAAADIAADKVRAKKQGREARSQYLSFYDNISSI